MTVFDPNRALKRADPSTIQDKFLVGYQGWFTAAGDGAPLYPEHHGWLHWINCPLEVGGRLCTDLWPDFSAYTPEELYPMPGLEMPDGSTARVFSSRHALTVRRHFRWMAEHAVDGAFLQRFVGQIAEENLRNQRDEIGDRVREAAEAEGRVFAIMYDVSGVSPDAVQELIERDWLHLAYEKRVMDSPNYLMEKGKPVIALWGFGFSDREFTPAHTQAAAQFIRAHTPNGAYIMAGVPAHWRTSISDAHPDPEYVQLWLDEFDAISPWSVGRYNSEESADNFAEEKVKGDVELIRQHNHDGEGAQARRQVDYVPVVFPGFSGVNTSQGNWRFNEIKRNGGRFLWRQIWNVKQHGVRIVYGAMWDEYDEGTAYLPVVAHKRQLPKSEEWQFLALDADGFDLPPDWYMRICGFAGEALRGELTLQEAFPVHELQEYWSSRPRLEIDDTSATATSATIEALEDDAEIRKPQLGEQLRDEL